MLPSLYPWLLDLITSDRDPFSFIQRFEEPVYKTVDCFGCFFVKCSALILIACVRPLHFSFMQVPSPCCRSFRIPIIMQHPLPNTQKKRPAPVAALPVIHHFTLAAILTSVSIFFPFNVYKTLPLFHVSTFSLAVASSCPPPFVLGAGR